MICDLFFVISGLSGLGRPYILVAAETTSKKYWKRRGGLECGSGNAEGGKTAESSKLKAGDSG